MFNKSFFEECKISHLTTDKTLIVETIHKYLNMFPQLMPLSNNKITSKLFNVLKEKNMTLLDSHYFTTNELKYAWDKGFYIVRDNNSQRKTVLIESGDKFSCISIRYSLQTLRYCYKMIVKDIYHQSFYLKCTKNIDFFINKMKAVKGFIKESEDRYIKTTNIIYNPCTESQTNNSFVHQFVIIRYNNLYKEWNYENCQKVVRGMPSIVAYIKDHIIKLSEKEKITNEEILSIIEMKNKKAIEEIQNNISIMANVINN